jgi:uncharacterized Rmd1/YagE family protein
MDCRAYCTAESYDIRPLYDFLKARYKTSLFRDVVHIEVPEADQIHDVFYFSYGATVTWGLTPEQVTKYLNLVSEFEKRHLDEIETDEFTFVFGDTPRIVEDEIVLPNKDVLTRLAISLGLAQSVKLGTFEIALQKTFNNTKHIPEELAKYGKVSLSRKEIGKKMGELFIERNSINLHVDILDTPEFFWEYTELEPLYLMTTNYLDIKRRVEVLNQRLDVVHELFEVLGNELNHQHSSRLELTIIMLIVIEVCLSLMRDVFHWT